jgi:hypothetical protein
MSQAHRFCANRDDRGSPETLGVGSWPRSRGVGAIAPALVLGALTIASTMAIAARAAIVSFAPATAAAYALAGMPVNLRGLSIAGVHATLTHNPQGHGELLVIGEITNLRGSETPLPDLRLALRAQDGRELYHWTARGPKASLGARERAPFRARLAAPPAGVRDVLVKFVEAGNKGSFTEIPP